MCTDDSDQEPRDRGRVYCPRCGDTRPAAVAACPRCGPLPPLPPAPPDSSPDDLPF